MEEFFIDAKESIENMYGATDLTLYFILFSILAFGIIYTNRMFGSVLEGGFKKSLNITSIFSYIFITNIALFYLLSIIIVDYSVSIDFITIIGYCIAFLIQVTMILFMISFMVLSAYYFVFLANFLKR